MITRRSVLHLAGLSLVQGCAGCTPHPAPPDDSPVYRGRFRVARALLGVTPGTEALPFPAGIPEDVDRGVTCSTGVVSVARPDRIGVMVYYPGVATSPVGQPVRADPGGPFPLVLYGHARRAPPCPSDLAAGFDPALLDVTLDYRRVDFVLDHVASHGFVVCAPDLSWQWGVTEEDDWPDLASARAQVMVALYDHMRTLARGPFQRAIDLNRLGLAGHSTGAAACLIARAHLADVGGPDPDAYAFLAPATTPQVAALAGDAGPMLVVKGTLDTHQQANPDEIYDQAPRPRVRVTIGGANHFGYTEVCSASNQVCAAEDPPGAIARLSQQVAGATFVSAALRRFLYDDAAMTPYLDGSRDSGVATFGAYDVLVDSDGL